MADPVDKEPSEEEVMEIVREEIMVQCLAQFTGEQRLSIFAHFCRGCGVKDPKCKCWNDE